MEPETVSPSRHVLLESDAMTPCGAWTGRPPNRRVRFVGLLAALTALVLLASTSRAQSVDGQTGPPPVTGGSTKRIVVLGSSTAAGQGASTPDSSWVGRYRTYIHGIDPAAEIVNLAVGGYTTYHVMPTGFVPPPGRPFPSTDHNITEAMTYEPWAVLVNLPSNDVAQGYSIAEQLANYDSLRAIATAVDVPLWIATAQPRNFSDSARRNALREMTDSTLARYAPRAIDFWTDLAMRNGTIRPEYDSGDGKHLNDSGHLLLSQRVTGADIWEEIVTGTPWPAVLASEPVLYQNHPNPARDMTRIGFRLRAPGRVSLVVYDVGGRKVATLAEATLSAGEHWVDWPGAPPAAGIYFYRLTTADAAETRKMTWIR